MCSNRLALLVVAGAVALCAQEVPLDPKSSIRINLPTDSPVALLSADLGESRAAARGSATVLDLHMALLLRNISPARIRGITLLVLTQELTPGGKASVALPALNVAPGDAFPVRIDLRLLRPSQLGGGPLVQVNLDGVLFEDLSFYGPNRLDSKRSMTAWELEAQRDRQYFKSVLTQHGPEALQREMQASLSRQAAQPRLDVRVARGRRAVGSAAAGERKAMFAFLHLPDSPIEPLTGWAHIAGSEARAPRIDVRNRSSKPVRYFEIGWIIHDRQGRVFWAASVPASEPELGLPPGRTGIVLQDTSLRFSRNSEEPLFIQGMTGFVSQVEFEDGKVWVPSRSSLQSARLLEILAPSPEEQRLTDLYRTKGLSAVIDELKKF